MKSKKIMKMALIFIGVIFMFGTYSFASPPIWETDYGDAIDDLTGCDDCETDVEISFAFPFDGETYTTVYVGTNGCLQLGDLGDDGYIDYDLWEYMEEFLNDSYPLICPLNTDLDLYEYGTVHLNDFGDRAVFTWNEVGTNIDNSALNTFQVQLYDDGTIIFGYNGILDDPGEDLIEDLDEGIVVGITSSDLPECEDPGTFDLNGEVFSAGTTIHQRWCYDEADTCECNYDDTWSGPINTAFDLDQQNVIFSPEGTGYIVNLPPGASSDASSTGGGSSSSCFINTAAEGLLITPYVQPILLLLGMGIMGFTGLRKKFKK